MRITNELRAKIDRAFSAKKNQQINALQDCINVIRSSASEDFAESLRMLAEDENYSPDFARSIVRLASGYRDPSVEDAARAIADKLSTDELDLIYAKVNEVKNETDRAKEEFLIAVSYADGDISSIKAVFAEYGITF